MILAQAARAVTAEEVAERHAAIAMRMDTAYREAGSRVDIAGFDLAEAQRQKRKVAPAITAAVAQADRELRAQWLALENERIGISRRIGGLGETGPGHVLSIENQSDAGSGESEWFALRRATVILQDGTRIEIAPRQFSGGSYRDSYSYQCEPAAMVAVYGRASTTHTLRAAIPLATKPRGAALEISGLDHDKPGRTSIRISLNGVTVNEGPNQFQKVGWSEKKYLIPDAAWSATVKLESPGDLVKDMDAWEARVAAFEAASARRANDIDVTTAPCRHNLVWQKRNYATDWWKHSFVRGLCYETDSTLGPDHNRPWFLDNKEYIAKAFDAAKVNLIYNYPGGDYGALGVRQYSEIARYNDPIGTPEIEVHWPSAHPESRSPKLDPPARWYNDLDAAHAELDKYLGLLEQGGLRQAMRGVAIDEPRIEDSDRFEAVPEILVAYRAYLLARKPVLDRAGLTIDLAAPPVTKVERDADLPAWMEWQYFKMDFVAKFYAQFARKMDAQDRIALVVAQDYLNHDPQVAPYPAYGANLPLVATDLYNDAGINEAFGMDLLRSVSRGKALLVNGAGYSARTPARFQRTLANGMLRSDGVVTWIYTYASKYRHRYFFLKPNMVDDRGRSLLDSWKPEYWDILAKTYAGMKNAEPYLANTASTAQVGVLYSMRSVVAASAQGTFYSGQILRNSLYTYNVLQDLHRSVEACMVEGLTPTKLNRYRVLYMVDGQCLTQDECARLRNWVEAGGTLIVSGRTGLKDEWGRPLKDYALAGIMGAHFVATRTGQSTMELNAGQFSADTVPYDSQYSYAQLRNEGATVLATWANGHPALLRKAVGKGQTYTISADRPGEYLCDSDAQSGRYKWHQPGFPELLCSIAKRHLNPDDVQILGAPQDMEVQLRRQGDAWIIQLLDWRDDRTVKQMKLAVRVPGVWRMSYPLDEKATGRQLQPGQAVGIRPVKIHDMILLEPVQQTRAALPARRPATKPKR